MNLEELNPGIRGLVSWLNNKGYVTSDSGDGTNYKNGMEGALPYPSVVIVREKHRKDLREAAITLHQELEDRGVAFFAPEADVCYSYSPKSGVEMILITGVCDKDAGL